MKSVSPFLVRVVDIFNLSAPGAAKLEKPLALSLSDESASALTNCSCIKRPTLYDGLFVYGSNTILSEETFTKCPRIKNTPFAIEAAQPVAVASFSIRVATESPAFIGVFPYTKPSSTSKSSPSSKNVTLLLLPESKYLIKNVKWVIPVESFGRAQLSTRTLMPLLAPVNILPFKLSRYTETATPK